MRSSCRSKRPSSCAEVAELADALASGASPGNRVKVRVLSSAPLSRLSPPSRRGSQPQALGRRPPGPAFGHESFLPRLTAWLRPSGSAFARRAYRTAWLRLRTVEVRRGAPVRRPLRWRGCPLGGDYESSSHTHPTLAPGVRVTPDQGMGVPRSALDSDKSPGGASVRRDSSEPTSGHHAIAAAFEGALRYFFQSGSRSLPAPCVRRVHWPVATSMTARSQFSPSWCSGLTEKASRVMSGDQAG